MLIAYSVTLTMRPRDAFWWKVVFVVRYVVVTVDVVVEVGVDTLCVERSGSGLFVWLFLGWRRTKQHLRWEVV
jgi:hypothetical protein